MRRKQPPIDIAQSVMQRIERDGISMRSKRYFTIRNIGRKVGLSAAVIFSLLGVTSLAYTLRNDVFNDYIDLASQARYINSLPWAGIVVTVVSIGLVVLSVRAIARQNQNFKLSYAFAVWFVLILGSVGLAFSLSPERTPPILARIAFVSDKDPSKIAGTITEIVGGDLLKVQVNDTILLVYTDTSGLKVGDKILVIGGRKNNNIYATAIKLVQSAPKHRQEEKKVEQIIETPKPEEPAKEEPKPAVTTIPTPAPTSPTSPAPEPTLEPAKTITIVAVGGPLGAAPNRKFQVNWSSNFTLENGYKLIWAMHPSTPTWPTPNYRYNGTSAASGTNYVRETLNAGTYRVRLCEYFPETSTCGIYSNEITVTFP